VAATLACFLWPAAGFALRALGDDESDDWAAAAGDASTNDACALDWQAKHLDMGECIGLPGSPG